GRRLHLAVLRLRLRHRRRVRRLAADRHRRRGGGGHRVRLSLPEGALLSLDGPGRRRRPVRRRSLAPEGVMDGPDEIIHQSTRLRIAATLNALPQGEMLEFGRLKAIMNATDGNMGTHLTALEKAGYIEVVKDFLGKKPRTRIALSP